MNPLPVWRRSAALLAAGAVALFGLTTAVGTAHAADEPVLPLVTASTVALPQPTDTDDPPQISWELDPVEDASAVTDIHVTLDLSGAASVAHIHSGPCTGDVCEWSKAELGHGAGGLVELTAAPDAPLGATGTAVLSGTADGATLTPMTVRITVGTVSLVVNQLPKTEHATPGSTLDAAVTVANTGQLPADGADLELTTTDGLGFSQHFANCVYSTRTVDKGYPSLTDDARCHFTTTLAPGTKYRLSAPLGIDVTSQALWDLVRYRVTPATGDAPAAGSGPLLSLVPDGAAPAGGQSSADWTIDADNTADLAAGGDTAHGAPGDKVVLTPVMRNEGPATVDVETSDAQLALMVDIPKGTTAVKVPDSCSTWAIDGPGGHALGAPKYICEIDRPFTAGQVVWLPFTVRIDADAPAVATGTARTTTVYGDEELPFDSHHANDTAALTVHVSGGATTSPSPTTTGAASTTAASGGGGGHHSVAPAAAGAPATGSGGTGGDTGTLASTGDAGTRLLAWTGAAALAFGGAVLALTRSRRTRRTRGMAGGA